MTPARPGRGEIFIALPPGDKPPAREGKALARGSEEVSSAFIGVICGFLGEEGAIF